MARKKLEVKATQEQLNKLYDSLKAGAPLQIALQRASISTATYYYWIAISSIVVAVKTQEEIEELENLANSGVSIQEIRDMASFESHGKKSDIGSYIEPKAESLLQYKNNRKFKKFADQCYEIIQTCDVLRSDFATMQLLRIAQSTAKKNGINPSGAMWWLERNMPSLFAKPSDKVKDPDNTETAPIPSIQVEFVDPGTTTNLDRLAEMEKKIFDEMNGGDKA